MFRIAHHQLRHGIVGVKPLKEDKAELIGNGHLDIVAFRQLERGLRSIDAFDHAMC